MIGTAARGARLTSTLGVRTMATGQNLAEAAPFGVRYGTGGRSSVAGVTATVFGSYGATGRYLMNELGACGSRVYAPFRGCEMEPRHLKPMFDLGGLGLMPFHPRDEASIAESLQHSDICVNMIGKHYETKHMVPTRRENGEISNINFSYEEVHVDIPRRLARLAKEAGIQSFVHVSALGASHDSKSEWCRTKAAGEDAVREEFPEAIIVRPATIFGPEDRFLNSIADMNERLPFLPILNDGATLTQPLYCVDFGQALFQIVQRNSEFQGATFELAGPAEYTYREIVEFVQDVATVSKPIVAMPEGAARFTGRLLNNMIEPWLTEDKVAKLYEDCVPSGAAEVKTLADLHIEPNSMDKYAFDFLHRFRPGGHFAMVQGYH